MPLIIKIILKILKKLIFISIIIFVLFILSYFYLSYLDKENIEIKPFGLEFGENDVNFVLNNASNKKIITEKCVTSNGGIMLGCEQRKNEYIEKLKIYNSLPNDHICRVTFGNKLFSPSPIYTINPPFPLSYKSIIYEAEVHPILGITNISANLTNLNDLEVKDIKDYLHRKYETLFTNIFRSYRYGRFSNFYTRYDTEDRKINIRFLNTNNNYSKEKISILYEWNTLRFWNGYEKKQKLMEECLDEISTIYNEIIYKNKSIERDEKNNKRIRDKKLNNDAL
jgi:hypothetical protein